MDRSEGWVSRQQRATLLTTVQRAFVSIPARRDVPDWRYATGGEGGYFRHLGISATAKGFIAIWVPGPTFSFPI